MNRIDSSVNGLASHVESKDHVSRFDDWFSVNSARSTTFSKYVFFFNLQATLNPGEQCHSLAKNNADDGKETVLLLFTRSAEAEAPSEKQKYHNKARYTSPLWEERKKTIPLTIKAPTSFIKR